MNCTSSGLVAIGAIAGGVTMNPIVLGVISGVGLIVKTASEMKNLKSKIEMSKFAFTTYEKTLSDLRFALRGGNFDQTQFLSSMEAIDGIVIDLGLDLEKFENKWKEKFSTADEILKKTFFRQTFGEEARQILSQNNSVKIQGMKKRNHEIFGVF